jgi:dissimilatory sulfite reductase (desulfoviridin) alpha/beta subunit
MKPKKTGVDLYAGGRWGREKQVGIKIAGYLSQEEAVLATGNIKYWYARNGRKRERLGQSILRVGPRAFQRAVLEGIPKGKWVTLTPEAEAAFAVLR